jgi:hypothetical protein
VVSAPDRKARLATVRKLREKQWLAKQPKALRVYIDKQPVLVGAGIVAMGAGTPVQVRPLMMAGLAGRQTVSRTQTIAWLKREQARHVRDWTIASRHWTELIDPKRPAMPARAADFGLEVETFVKEYLRPALEPEERSRLERAEGQWPLYPVTLVELADKHPMALPQKRGPTAFKQLPTEVQKKLEGKMVQAKEGKKAKDYDQFFKIQESNNAKEINARLTAIMPPREVTPPVKFATAVASWAHSKKGAAKMPYELWAAKSKDMSVAMRVFLDEKGQLWNHLTMEERESLLRAEVEGKWPEHPLKIQELAAKYGLRPPWQTLPDIGNKSEVWEKYRLKP